MSQSERIFGMVDTISHFFSIKKGMNEYPIVNSPVGPTRYEITSSPSPFIESESGLKLSNILNYVKVADDGSVGNASSSDVVIDPID